MKKPYQPFDDGLTFQERNKMRKHTWANIKLQKISEWTEKMCNQCFAWNHKDRPEEWCEHFGAEAVDVDAPAVQAFKPYFNPNIQPGGAYLRTRADEKRCMKLSNKEFIH